MTGQMVACEVVAVVERRGQEKRKCWRLSESATSELRRKYLEQFEDE